MKEFFSGKKLLIIGFFVAVASLLASDVRAAATFPCSKCAPNFAFTKAAYKSTTANCNTPVADSITYSCDCTCGSVSATQASFGNCRAQCANVPSPTPTTAPTPTTTVGGTPYPCPAKCSANYDYTKASSYTSTTANCANPIAGSITYSCDCSCGTNNTLHQVFGSCTQQCAGTTPSPAPTTANGCACVADSCSSTCMFDAYADVAYSTQKKCSLSAALLFSPPDAGAKNAWCTATKRTKGDANGDGTVNLLDYMYYISASFGGKVPPSVNPDFSGDGEIGASDRSIIIKSLAIQ